MRLACSLLPLATALAASADLTFTDVETARAAGLWPLPAAASDQGAERNRACSQ